jgi:hypothetical protein
LGKARPTAFDQTGQARHASDNSRRDQKLVANRTPVEAKAIKRGAQEEVDVWRRGMENDAGGSSAAAGC